MKTNKIGIYDNEINYAYRLMEVLNIKKQILFEAEVFTAKESLLLYLENHSLDVLLIQDSEMCEELNRYSVKKIILLSEGRKSINYKYPVIYKYQSSEMIIREIMNYYAENADADAIYSKQKIKIYGIYSPVRQIDVTAFALALGQFLLKQYSVLYLNLELFSGIKDKYGSENARGLSELMYYVNQDTEGIVYMISGMAEKLMGLDWIQPLESPEDLQDIKVEEWLKLLSIIRTQSNYEALLVQLNEGVPEFCRILEVCDRIFMPVPDKKHITGPLEEYKRFLIKTEQELLIKKTLSLEFGYDGFKNAQGDLEKIINDAEIQKLIESIMKKESNAEYR